MGLEAEVWDSATFPCGSAGKESTSNVGDLGSISGLGRSPGEGKGCPLQYSDLENSMGCIDHGVAKGRTQLSDFHFPLGHVNALQPLHHHPLFPILGTNKEVCAHCVGMYQAENKVRKKGACMPKGKEVLSLLLKHSPLWFLGLRLQAHWVLKQFIQEEESDGEMKETVNTLLIVDWWFENRPDHLWFLSLHRVRLTCRVEWSF